MMPEELLMTVQVTPNEVIAMNVAVNFYCKHCTASDPHTPDLLARYLHRLIAQIKADEQEATKQ